MTPPFPSRWWELHYFSMVQPNWDCELLWVFTESEYDQESTTEVNIEFSLENGFSRIPIGSFVFRISVNFFCCLHVIPLCIWQLWNLDPIVRNPEGRSPMLGPRVHSSCSQSKTLTFSQNFSVDCANLVFFMKHGNSQAKDPKDALYSLNKPKNESRPYHFLALLMGIFRSEQTEI